MTQIPTPSHTRRPLGSAAALLATALAAACSGGGHDSAGGSGARSGTGSTGSGSTGSGSAGAAVGGGGGDTNLFGAGGSTGVSGNGAGADAGFVACIGTTVEGEQVKQMGPLDIYLVFDRTASMGQDCAFTPGTTPPVASKACFATYAISQYFMSVNPADDTHLAFQFMSLATDDCNGVPYATPLIDMTPLPVAANHALIQAISNETFVGGLGTHIEGAIRGISTYTTNHDLTVGRPAGRTTIGVLMTDGDPNGCDENVANLAQLVANHTAATMGAVKMFFIGETGATLANLESYAVNGGAAPHTDSCNGGPSPCHYWDVGDGQPAAFASAMASIVGQATVSHPLPCTFKVSTPPDGQTLDPNKVNVTFTDKTGQASGIYRVDSEAACDPTLGGWHYDNPAAPTEILLCKSSCSSVSASTGANVSVEFGCASKTPPLH